MGKARKLTLFWSDANDCWVAFKSYWKAIPSEQSASVVDEAAYQKAVDTLKEIAKDRYEANPWTVVSTTAAKKAEDVLKELGELG